MSKKQIINSTLIPTFPLEMGSLVPVPESLLINLYFSIADQTGDADKVTLGGCEAFCEGHNLE
jgi:hypothetical protein